jgi:hypothetical protein
VATLHHQPFLAAVVALAAIVHDGPGDSVADSQRTITGIMDYPFSQLYDFAYDFMSKDNGRWG